MSQYLIGRIVSDIKRVRCFEPVDKKKKERREADRESQCDQACLREKRIKPTRAKGGGDQPCQDNTPEPFC